MLAHEESVIIIYVNLYEYISTGSQSLSHGTHHTAGMAKQAARGTCRSGRKRCIARTRVSLQRGKFDE